MIPRHLAPAADPFSLSDLWHGVIGALQPAEARARFTCDLAALTGAEHTTLVSSGRAALTLALRALRQRSPRTVVVIPAYACYTVAAAVAKAGLQVRLCDVVPETLDFDYDQLERELQTDVLCVISAHLLGCRADTPRVRSLCARIGAFVVDDAAQAYGVVADQGVLGTLGDVGIYSFSRGKLLSGVHGGAVVTRSPELAAALHREESALSEPGWLATAALFAQAVALWLFLDPRRYWIPAALPFLGLGETVYDTMFAMQRMSGLAAGLMANASRRLAQGTTSRLANAAALYGSRAPVPVTQHAPVRLPVLCASAAERDRLLDLGARRGLGFSRMYPSSLAAIQELTVTNADQACPGAEALAARLITVPVHAHVSPADVDAIRSLLQTGSSRGHSK